MPLNQVDISMMQDIPAPGVAGKIIISDGAGWTSGTNAPVGSIVKQATNPTHLDPATPSVGDMILNNITGELWCCTTVAANDNVWKATGDGTGTIASNLQPTNPTDDMPDLAESSTTTHTFTGGTDSDGTVTHYHVDTISNSSLLAVTTAEVAAGSAHEFVTQSVTTNTAVTFRVRTKDNGGLYSSGITVSININDQFPAHFMMMGGGGTAGIGGPGSGMAGGGGAGGLRTSYGTQSGRLSTPEAQLDLAPGTTYVITVGAGVGGDAWHYHYGEDTSIVGGSVNKVAEAGGYGQGASGNSVYGPNNENPFTATAGGNGGCGGSGHTVAGQGTAGQGFDGEIVGTHPYGGGGGTGQEGGTNATTDGGHGVRVDIDGNNYYWGGGGGGSGHGSPAGDGGYGGGGGGSAYSSGTLGVGGGTALNPGANGVAAVNGPGGNGGANTGGGGGGGSDSAGTSPVSGSGIVMLRMATTNFNSGGITGGTSATIGGTDTLITFLGDGEYVA